ncbi:hypothetical protein [Luteolibacter soli]|uniref:DUF3592 domain-containing protein n=1 Tax=Luteolibacter soli TaxID=3135280 RepID=A0ABU9B496_9BACT
MAATESPLEEGPRRAEFVVRPWYRSRLFWAGMFGLLFLLWAWWNSGAYSSTFTAESRGGEPILHGEVSSGSLLVRWQRRNVSLSPLQWTFTADRWGLGEHDPATRAPTPRPRQFDVVWALRVKEERDGLGKNPAAAGWVPSPGRSLPVSKLMLLEYQVAWWLVVLVYLLAGALLLAYWQLVKARRRERHGGPGAVISLRLWFLFVVLLALTGCFLDSIHSRTRGGMGNGKYDVGWSHFRGLFTVSVFYAPLASDGVAPYGKAVRESMTTGGFTPQRWPRWIGPDIGGENSWELRLPTTLTIGAYVVLWSAAAWWRWQRFRRHLRKLSRQDP